MIRDLRPDPNLRGKGPISEWYGGRSVFITGATGFMGKVLLEKLLFQCTKIKQVFILIRSKRGRTAEQRIQDMWKLPVFERLRKADPEAVKKIVPVQGELTSEGLGLSKSDRKSLIDEISIIFHCAATLKLEAKLKDAIEMNTAGTDRVLDLAKEMKKLKVFVHLSTSFCSADLPEFKEKVYHTRDNPKEIIQVGRWIKEEALDTATPSIISPHPNTYTYTKRLAESLVADEYPNLPIVIARPSIVTPAGAEPIPGWVDSLNGPMGLIVGAGKGVIRSMHVKADSRAQVVPVDIAINALVVIAWKMGSAEVKPAEMPVYNMTNDGVISMTWGSVLACGKSIAYDYPFEGQIWYPDGDIRASKFMHWLCCIFMHWLPAYFIDFLMLAFRQKRFMVRLTKRIDNGLELLQFFTTRDWYFDSRNFLSLNSVLTKEEQRIFCMDYELMPVTEYFTVALLGARQYLMKEDLSTLPRCRRVQKLLYVIDRAFALAFYFGLIWMVYSYSDTVRNMFDYAGSYLQSVPMIGTLVPATTKL